MALAAKSDRYGDVVVLATSGLNVGSSQSQLHELPPGFGDCLVLEACLTMQTVATPNVGTDLGVAILVVRAATGAYDSGIDFVGSGRAVRAADELVTGVFQAVVQPDGPVLLKQDEFLWARWAEFDTNAVPTGDWELLVKVQRLRTPAPAPEDRVMLVHEGTEEGGFRRF